MTKRHGFKGLGASHGTQRKHRAPGSIGGLRHPGPGVQGRADGLPDGRRAHDLPLNLTVHGVDTDLRTAADQGRGPRLACGLVVLVRSAVKTPALSR